MKRVFSRQIVFSKTPLKTNFRFDDQFQIFPCDFKNTPVSRFQTDFPIMLEYWYDDDEAVEISEDFEDLENVSKFISRNSKVINKANRLTFLCRHILICRGVIIYVLFSMEQYYKIEINTTHRGWLIFCFERTLAP